MKCVRRFTRRGKCLTLLVAAGWASAGAAEAPIYRARLSSQTYHLYVPTAYTSETAWPLFICVHGAHASGVGDFRLWRQYADPEGFILLAPNFTGHYHLFQREEDRALVKLIDELSETYRIDRGRVLLSGFSRGGEFAYRFALKHPTRAHTVAVFNAGNLPAPFGSAVAMAPRFYLAVGSEEREYARQAPGTIARLRRAGFEAELLIAAGVGHSIPSRGVVDVLRLFRAMRDQS